MGRQTEEQIRCSPHLRLGEKKGPVHWKGVGRRDASNKVATNIGLDLQHSATTKG